MFICIDTAVLHGGKYNGEPFANRLGGYDPRAFFICMRNFIVCITR